MALMTPSSKTSQASLVDGLSITACCIGTPVDTDLNAVSDAVPQLPVFNELDVEISTMEIKRTIAAIDTLFSLCSCFDTICIVKSAI